jgi:hypothetical protein
MSMNWALAVGAVFVASMGTIAGACKRSGVQETSATPNNIVRNNTASVFSSNEIISPRKLGAELAAC